LLAEEIQGCAKHRHEVATRSVFADNHIKHSEFPSEQTPQQHNGNLIDKRRGYEERHGYADGDTRNEVVRHTLPRP